MMLGDKRFDVDKNDNIFVDEIKYVGTPGLYKLIFRLYRERLPDGTVYTEGDKHKYKSILKATNAHRRGNIVHNLILSNKGYKYKYTGCSKKVCQKFKEIFLTPEG